MSAAEIADLRNKFIDKRSEILKRKVSATEAKLYDSVFSKLIKELDASNGLIMSNNRNIDLVTLLDNIFAEFNKSDYINVIRSFAGDLSELQTYSHRYFSIIEEDQAKVDAAQKAADAIMRKRIGLNTKDEVIKKGYLDRLITDNTLLNQVKEETYKSVTAGKPIEDYIGKIKRLIVGTDQVAGGLQKHFNQFAFDTYAQFSRTTDKLYANKLGLQCFIYSGGTITTSRDFCIKNNNKVFTTDEAQKWKSMVGKKNGPISDENYDPLTDCGGWNCRHQPNYISNSLAISKRPELAEILS